MLCAKLENMKRSKYKKARSCDQYADCGRTYGPWWTKLRCRTISNRAPANFRGQDYVDLLYDCAVWPRGVKIYETYNPGCVVRILACDTSPSDLVGSVDHVRWFVLWSGEPQTGLPARSRLFSPPLNQCPFPTNLIRLEINQSHCWYYTEIDAVELCGYPTQPKDQNSTSDPSCDLQDDIKPVHSNAATDSGNQSLTAQSVAVCVECGATECSEDSVCTEQGQSSADRGIAVCCCSCCSRSKQLPPVTPTSQSKSETQFTSLERITKGIAELHVQTGLPDALAESDNSHFDLLPDEVIQHIISYLDLHTLASLSSACQLFHKHCYDPMQYSELNLQPYWPQVTDEVLENLAGRCRYMHSLNLSWCGPYRHISPAGFSSFIQNVSRSKELRRLSLASCTFLTDSCIEAIVDNVPQLQELDIQSCLGVHGGGFQKLSGLKRLTSLNLYRTNVPTGPLLIILRNNPGLEDLNIGSCELSGCDDVTRALGEYCKQLKVLDLWRSSSVSPAGIQALVENCPLLTQLDLGWCGGIRPIRTLFQDMAKKCKCLKKIFLTAHRSVGDSDVIAFAEHLPDLEQLDLLGTNVITDQAVKRLLEGCPKLEFLDLSFCGSLSNSAVSEWQRDYPRVDIKRSYQEQ